MKVKVFLFYTNTHDPEVQITREINTWLELAGNIEILDKQLSSSDGGNLGGRIIVLVWYKEQK